ncbi:hypothetical protein BKA69DRAFT_646157 [Paraphysoderma sedebokerense]|nr:hypothetical protein BKA69DRAFT_646157 [Paraphysoderma sedebokerense]
MKAIPISPVGCAVIIAFVSWTNFQTGKSLTSLNEQDPTLLIRTSFRLFPFVEILLSNPSNDGLCDKGLFLLQFIISSARPRSYFVGDNGAEPSIGINAGFDSFSRLAQTLTMFMTMSPNQSFRLQAFQNLSKFLALLPEDIEWRVLKDYLSSLPYDSTISAIINLLKDRVHDGYSSISPSSFYASPLFVSTFFPLLFDTSSHIYLPSQTAVGNSSRSVSILSSTTLFFDKVGIIMQVLNLWLYMLLRDDPRKSKSAVWTAAFLETTEQAYLEKLRERVEQLETDLNHGKVITQSHGERDEDNVSDDDEWDRQIELDNKLSSLNLLKSVILRIKQVINEGRAKRDAVDDEE